MQKFERRESGRTHFGRHIQGHFLVGLFLVAALLVSMFGCSSASTSSTDGTIGDKSGSGAAGAANPGLLVETDWLAQKLTDTSVKIVDARKPEEYKAGHIEGAVNIPHTAAFLPGAAQGIVGSPEQIAKLFGDQGITNDTTVVIYDAGKAYLAPYLFWALEYYGHRKVSVLNGGYTKWKKENKATSTTEPAVKPAVLTVKADPAKRALLADVKAALGKSIIAILDSRAPAEYSGDQVAAKRGGHIPGAINVDWVNLFNDDGAFKSAAAIANLYADKGITKDKKVIAHCQVGFRSAASYLSLRLLGYDASNYDASWNEWGNDTTLPVEK